MYFALHCITLLPRVSQLITTPHYIQSRDTIHSPRTPHIPLKILGKLIYIHITKRFRSISLFYFHKDFIRTLTKSSIPSVNLHLSIWLCSASMIRWACCGKPTNAQHILQILFTVHCTLYATQCAVNCTIAQKWTSFWLNCAFPTRATVHFLPVRGQCILGPEANQLGVHGGNNALKKRHSNDLVERKQ